jgi:hypothetical protein
LIASSELLLLINGFLAAVILVTLIAVCFGLWKVRQGWLVLQTIQTIHNELVQTIAAVDAKAQDCSLRLDHIKLKNPI